MATDLSQHDLLVIQIDGLHLDDSLLMIGAVRVDAEGTSIRSASWRGPRRTPRRCRALLDNLIERGLDPAVCRLFIVDGAKALTKAIRHPDSEMSGSQGEKRDGAPRSQASRRRPAGPAAGLGDGRGREGRATSAQSGPSARSRGPRGVQGLLEGLDEILTVTRLGLPPELRRSLASTNIIVSMNSVIRQVCRNVNRWRNAKIGLHWTAPGMLEAAKGFRRLKAHKQLPILKDAIERLHQKRSHDLR